MRCRHCNEKVKDHDFWCIYCGHQTGVIKTYLRAKMALNEEWEAFTTSTIKSYGFAILNTLVFLILGGGAYWFSLNDSLLPISHFSKYLLNNLVFLIVIPFFLTPFEMASHLAAQPWSMKDYFISLKEYPRYFVFVFFNIVYFFALKYICTGDPILHLVRFVMVLYWISIVLPAPVIMQELKLNPFQVIVKSYQVGRETRWQLFFLWFMLFVINFVALLPVGLGLLVTLPLTYRVIYRYYKKLDEFELVTEPEQVLNLKSKQA